MVFNSRRTPPDNGEISFPLLESWNPVTKVATIAAQVHKTRVLCRISGELLQKQFRTSADEPMKAVRENRPAIEAAARKLITNKAYEADGSIVIRGRDL